MEKQDSRFLELVEKDPIFRTFLFLAKNRAKVKLVLSTGQELEGHLRTIDVFYRAFKIETENGTYVVNWRHVVFISYED
jgi:hypothetical protein